MLFLLRTSNFWMGTALKMVLELKCCGENGVWWKGTIEQVEDDDEAMETGNDSSDEEVLLAHLG